MTIFTIYRKWIKIIKNMHYFTVSKLRKRLVMLVFSCIFLCSIAVAGAFSKYIASESASNASKDEPYRQPSATEKAMFYNKNTGKYTKKSIVSNEKYAGTYATISNKKIDIDNCVKQYRANTNERFNTNIPSFNCVTHGSRKCEFSENVILRKIKNREESGRGYTQKDRINEASDSKEILINSRTTIFNSTDSGIHTNSKCDMSCRDSDMNSAKPFTALPQCLNHYDNNRQQGGLKTYTKKRFKPIVIRANEDIHVPIDTVSISGADDSNSIPSRQGDHIEDNSKISQINIRLKEANNRTVNKFGEHILENAAQQFFIPKDTVHNTEKRPLTKNVAGSIRKKLPFEKHTLEHVKDNSM